jgi:hypothetical protein
MCSHTFWTRPFSPAVISKFGIESILIYIAVLLKKRVVVVCPDPEELVTIVRVLPQVHQLGLLSRLCPS